MNNIGILIDFDHEESFFPVELFDAFYKGVYKVYKLVEKGYRVEVSKYVFDKDNIEDMKLVLEVFNGSPAGIYFKPYINVIGINLYNVDSGEITTIEWSKINALIRLGQGVEDIAYK